MPGHYPRVYLDHNATSPLRPPAAAALRRVIDAAAGNPASMHTEGRAARAQVEEARESVARLIEARASEIVFTSGGTEAIAAAVRGVCDRAPASMRELVVTTVEHSAVLEAVAAAERFGFQVRKIPCDGDGRVDPDRFAAALGSGVALAAVQWANNETGVIQPVEEIGRSCRRAGVAFLVDAVQAVGKLAVDPARAHADLFALSSHKIGGPQGVGALWVRQGLVLAPLICGGAAETRRRGGTPGVSAIAGFGAAALSARADRPDDAGRLLRLRAKIETRLHRDFPDVTLHGQGSSRLPNTVNFSIPGVDGEALAVGLDLAGFAVSTGSACASGAVEPSHVIRAMGCGETEARGAVRVSLGWSSTADEVDRFLDRLPSLARQVRHGSATDLSLP